MVAGWAKTSLIDWSQMPDGRPNILDVAGIEQRGSPEYAVLVPAGRAGRLGTALAGIAHELADSRRDVAGLRRENATLRARLSDSKSHLPQTGAVRLAGASQPGVNDDEQQRTIDGTAGDATRERLSQDLHDGVQQRLTALRIRVAIAGQSFESRDDTAASVVLNDIGDEVDQAIDEVRAFAHGVYPVLLTSSGLRPALASAARRSPGSVTIQVSGVGRYSSDIETAVYFSCLAALDNAAKHACSAPVSVRVWDHANTLHFTVSDTGQGFDLVLTPAGAGITNMRDRIHAVCGSLTVDSTPQGTVVEGSVPHAG
jgi:signal transduction histidine kinase